MHHAPEDTASRDDKPTCYCGGWQEWLEHKIEDLLVFVFELVVLIGAGVAFMFAALFIMWLIG